MESQGSSGPQLVMLALIAILVVAAVAAVAIAAINRNDRGGEAEPTPILPPVLPTDSGPSGGGYPSRPSDAGIAQANERPFVPA